MSNVEAFNGPNDENPFTSSLASNRIIRSAKSQLLKHLRDELFQVRPRQPSRVPDFPGNSGSHGSTELSGSIDVFPGIQYQSIFLSPST